MKKILTILALLIPVCGRTQWSGDVVSQSSITTTGGLFGGTASITSTVTAAAFAGDGSKLTNLPPVAGITDEYYTTPQNSDISGYYLMLSSFPVVAASTITTTVPSAVIVSTHVTPVGFPNITSINPGTWATHYWANQLR